ncbi:SGNH/GDSL hydrolase family protein [Streptomyces lavendulocolor]|uniref:SGNH/GDSL hydrolase family protein n=1 Tax=Streptomyces lavendulocolor TaxID=67316 RepID=UPI0033DD9CBB
MGITPRRRLTASVTAVVLACLGAAPVTPAAADEPLRYVALGDSFAASPQVPPPDIANLLCLRSLANYPHAAARALRAELTDVSCSAATVEDLRSSQYPGTGAQFDALSARTDLVSITVGGMDTGLPGLALDCLNTDPEPAGVSCAATYTAGGTDRIRAAIDTWAPSFAAALGEISRRAPHAKVAVVGYGNVIRPGGCFPAQPVWRADADYLHGVFRHLDTRLRQAAQRHGALYVDTYRLGAGHDACAAPADRYIEGWLRTRAAMPLHPNAEGARAIGTALAAAFRGTAPRAGRPSGA